MFLKQGFKIWAIIIVVLTLSTLAFPGLALAQGGTPDPVPNNFLALGILAFIAGVLSFTSPCTLPILPAYFAFTFQAERKKVALMGLAFFLGLATTFTLLGGSATLLGSLLREYRSTIITFGGVLIMALGVLTLFGKGLPGFHIADSQPRPTVTGSYLFGATFAFGWTACIAPVLGSILILASTTQTVYQGMLLLFIYSLGLGLPLILLATFVGTRSRDSFVWRILRGKGRAFHLAGQEFYLHTTNVFSGLLLVGVGGLMASGYLTIFNQYIPVELQIWFNGIEEWFARMLAG